MYRLTCDAKIAQKPPPKQVGHFQEKYCHFCPLKIKSQSGFCTALAFSVSFDRYYMGLYQHESSDSIPAAIEILSVNKL